MFIVKILTHDDIAFSTSSSFFDFKCQKNIIVGGGQSSSLLKYS